MIKIKNLDDLLTNDLRGKTVYLRADLNLPTINGKVTAQGRSVGFPYNSPFTKLANLPKNIPTGATQDTVSNKVSSFNFFL